MPLFMISWSESQDVFGKKYYNTCRTVLCSLFERERQREMGFCLYTLYSVLWRWCWVMSLMAYNGNLFSGFDYYTQSHDLSAFPCDLWKWGTHKIAWEPHIPAIWRNRGVSWPQILVRKSLCGFALPFDLDLLYIYAC